MPESSTEVLLSAWERGLTEPHAVGRALALLGVACPDSASVSLAEFSIGARDALLLRLQEELFGGHVGALAICAGCDERVELSFDVSDVRVLGPTEAKGPLTASWEQHYVEFRLPNSRDLLNISEPIDEDIEGKRKRLLHQIVLRAGCADQSIAVEELPEELVSAMELAMQEADRQGEVHLNLRCQSCGHEWKALFDVSSFLWKEVDAWAIRLLREVHVLARSYGWKEADILAMSPWRRNAYLEMLGA